MKDWLKHNWFKVSFIILTIVAGTLVLVGYNKSLETKDINVIETQKEPSANLAQQEACAKDAIIYYKQFWNGKIDLVSNPYVNHYNSSDGKCYIEFKFGSTEDNSNWIVSIYDTNSDQLIAYGEFDGPSSHATGFTVNGNQVNLSDFNNAVQSLMYN